MQWLTMPTQCAVGLSGVIFCLKTIFTFHDYGQRDVFFGMLRTEWRYAVWVELLFIQLITPNVSFTGHLAGILVGLLICKVNLSPLLMIAAKKVKDFRMQIFPPPQQQPPPEQQQYAYRW